MWSSPTARSIPVTVGRMHLRALDALQVCSGVWKDPLVPVRIKVPKTDPCESRRHCVFSWSHAMNLLNDNCHCEDGVLSFAHGNILAEETVPAAVKLHADRLLVRPMEGPSIVPPFATGSVCSWFTVPAGHCSAGVADSVMVLCVAAALGGVWALLCATLEDGLPVAGAMHFPGRFISRTHRRTPDGPCSRVQLPAHGQPQHGEECCLCAWQGAVGGGGLDDCRDGCEGAPRLRRH
ncbi:surface protease GP63, putative [Trypanosoma cruzi]|uniref:Leishmanolysin-like peptidase n=1 Tax=Trypanosoma cruzi (strain CL Brener) TaxID=353153 RepID=Q4E4Y1_TRYCC|nr:surface protease GP63, putative [Trypanosoma cruzi]EAN99830.1 surface protease GP63, putative [Trypanosoma cruzi]|eukprot:XP_821681.1 surface protease GP63 [Trypanosoma cruzi strain CL Brener]